MGWADSSLIDLVCPVRINASSLVDHFDAQAVRQVRSPREDVASLQEDVDDIVCVNPHRLATSEPGGSAT